MDNEKKEEKKKITKKKVVTKKKPKDIKMTEESKLKVEKKPKILKNENIEKQVQSNELDNTYVEAKEERMNSFISDNKKGKSFFSLAEVIVIMIVTAFFGALVGAVVTYVKNDKGKISELKTSNKNIVEFINTYDELVNDYYKDVDQESLIKAAIKGMIGYLGDPYSQYLDPSESDTFNDELNGKFIGMGAEIALNKDNKVVIMNVFADSPAEKAGIKAGDIINKVGNKEVTGLTAGAVANLIKNGAIGTKENINITRDGKTMDIEVTRGEVEIISVCTDVIEKNGKKVGIITITSFNKNTAIQFRARYNELKQQNIDSLVIDVRDNNGGHLSIAEEIAKLFLNKGDIIYQLDTKGKISHVKSDSNKTISLPTIILANNGSASSSEVLIGALKDNLDVKVVGEKTYGKGTVQSMHKLATGGSIKYTIQNWLTPKGNRIDKIGIDPTIEITLDEGFYENPSNDTDNQLQRALEEITK